MNESSLPKISIVTANLNGAPILERAIQSIISQDYQNLEYVIIDGGSTDNSLDIIERYADKIDVFLIEKDQGISDAFNKGIKKATGDIIGIISSDDFLAEGVLNYVAESYLQNNHPDVIYGDAGFLEDNKISLVRPDKLDKIWSRQPLKHSSVFVSRNTYEKWGKFSLEYQNAMDYELLLRFYLAGAKFIYIPKTLSYFSAGGVNQKNLTQTIKEVRNISIKHGRSKLKANFTWFGKFIKIFLKRVLLVTELTPVLSIYRFLSPRYRTKGLFITFSGIDGAGKSTQITHLTKFFQDNGKRPVYIWSRGGYTSFLENVKSLLRRILKRSLPPSGHSEKRTQYFEKKGIRRVWLYAALLDLMRVYGLNIRIWQMLGRPVICDRYLDDTLIDFKMNFPKEDVENWIVWRFLRWIAPRPDSSFLLMIPLEESIRRSQIKKDPFPEEEQLRHKRYGLYEELAKSCKLHVIDGTKEEVEVREKIRKIVNSLQEH